jgi:hypothetical protein
MFPAPIWDMSGAAGVTPPVPCGITSGWPDDDRSTPLHQAALPICRLGFKWTHVARRQLP